MARAETGAAAVGSRRLTAWNTASLRREGTRSKPNTAPTRMFPCGTLMSEKLPHRKDIACIEASECQQPIQTFTESCVKQITNRHAF
jgi:hypothetical protein